MMCLHNCTFFFWQVFDHNNDSYIDHEEIKRTMHFLGESVSDDDVRAMIQEADADHDGLVDFEGVKLSERLQCVGKRKAVTGWVIEEEEEEEEF
ncbi:unnamed protein product [Hydatigera taeniaeformis]|uniref:EF-hand domain-containing protein n=1 Tax=Hydatigena taeniaeformis TaxID=6205 RepID=A0A0R3WPK9_HYDTA|nr:unnamed protein product [Hydatigera taeniaeformis]